MKNLIQLKASRAVWLAASAMAVAAAVIAAGPANATGASLTQPKLKN